ncbi:Annexin A8 [Camelus dromedarius]|uniref:Annexin A8 n=1 Tax=Camelus dromedarius TaxID=9838 RepID=A0A5N4DKB2_CAMDR|nr:Annexin A8 [Camelus dromedarius]
MPETQAGLRCVLCHGAVSLHWSCRTGASSFLPCGKPQGQGAHTWTLCPSSHLPPPTGQGQASACWDLYAVGEKICRTDEMKFITILCTHSATHLMRVFEEYQKVANKSIEHSIRGEAHGSLEEAMLTVGERRSPVLRLTCVRRPQGSVLGQHQAPKAKGPGCSSKRLGPMFTFKLNAPGTSSYFAERLYYAMKEDTSGDYKNALLNLVGNDR